jgi:hypothetical protein
MSLIVSAELGRPVAYGLVAARPHIREDRLNSRPDLRVGLRRCTLGDAVLQAPRHGSLLRSKPSTRLTA